MSLTAYQSNAQSSAENLPRVDLILNVYDAVAERLALAKSCLSDDPEQSRALMRRCEVAILTLAHGISDAPVESAPTFLRLYEFMAHRIAEATPESLQDALDILTMLREGFEAVRKQALELERMGLIPPLADSQVQALA